MDALLRRIARSAFRRTMAGEHWAWSIIALSAFVIRRARQPHEPVETFQLRAGEKLLISVTGAGGLIFLIHRFRIHNHEPLLKEIETLPAELP